MQRANRSKTLLRFNPPSPSLCSDDEEQDRDNYFLGNPDRDFDILPQPFRMIDRILEEILDAMNDKICRVEELNILKNAAKKVPICNNPSPLHLQQADKNCDSELPDLDLTGDQILISVTATTVFIAKEREVQAIDLLTSKFLCKMKIDTDAGINLIKAVSLRVPPSTDCPFSSVDLLFVSNELGHLFVYGFVQKYFVPLQMLKQQPQNLSSKVTDCRFCADINKFYVVRYDRSLGYSVEMFRVPTDGWVSGLLQAYQELNTLKEDSDVENEDSSIEIGESKLGLVEEKIPEEKEENPLPPASSTSLFKNSSIQLVSISVMTPPRDNPCNSSNLHSLMRSLDLSRVGNGEKHPLSAQFFEILKDQLRTDLKKIMQSSEINDDDTVVDLQSVYPTIHFLLGTDSTHSKVSNYDLKVCKHEFIGMWWSAKNKFSIYSLGKSGKDSEPILDAVYPNSDNILASCTNNDTSLVALALENRNVVVWNRMTGAPSQVLSSEDSIDFFEFGRVTGEALNSDVLLMCSRTGFFKKISWLNERLSQESIIDSSLVKQTEVLHLSVIQKLGWLVFVARSPNLITVFDLDTASTICHFQLPKGYRIDKSVNECFVVDANATKLFVLVEVEHSSGEYVHGIFSFSLHAFCFQEESLSTDSCVSSDGLENVMVGLMNKIKQEQCNTQERQCRRWKEYSTELKLRKR